MARRLKREPKLTQLPWLSQSPSPAGKALCASDGCLNTTLIPQNVQQLPKPLSYSPAIWAWSPPLFRRYIIRPRPAARARVSGNIGKIRGSSSAAQPRLTA